MRLVQRLHLFAALAAAVAASGEAANAQRADSAVFRGRVLRAPDLAPLPGADVSLPVLHLHATTDSAGTFRFAKLPVGVQVAEVRLVGFVMRRDTITLTAGWESVRTYALEARPTPLDTVRTVAPGQANLSPALRAFEQRLRAHQGGYFISDSEFRRNENETLANLVIAHMPGVAWSYIHSHRVLVSSRKPCRGLALGHACSTKQDCYVAVYVDGTLYFNAKMADENVDPPDMEKDFDTGNLAGAEYYPGGASAPVQMHTDDDGCGSLWLWTREH